MFNSLDSEIRRDVARQQFASSGKVASKEPGVTCLDLRCFWLHSSSEELPSVDPCPVSAVSCNRRSRTVFMRCPVRQLVRLVMIVPPEQAPDSGSESCLCLHIQMQNIGQYLPISLSFFVIL